MIGARCLAALAFAAGVLPAVAADAPPVLATGASPAVAAGVPPAAAAPAGYPAELPPLGRVRSAIEEAPDVRAASALRDAGLAERRQLIAGPHEWSTRAEYRNRRTSDTPVVDRFGEWELALERAEKMEEVLQKQQRDKTQQQQQQQQQQHRSIDGLDPAEEIQRCFTLVTDTLLLLYTASGPNLSQLPPDDLSTLCNAVRRRPCSPVEV